MMSPFKESVERFRKRHWRGESAAGEEEEAPIMLEIRGRKRSLRTAGEPPHKYIGRPLYNVGVPEGSVEPVRRPPRGRHPWEVPKLSPGLRIRRVPVPGFRRKARNVEEKYRRRREPAPFYPAQVLSL